MLPFDPLGTVASYGSTVGNALVSGHRCPQPVGWTRPTADLEPAPLWDRTLPSAGVRDRPVQALSFSGQARSVSAWTTSHCLCRLRAHGLIAKIARTCRWRVTHRGGKVMGTTMRLRELHFRTSTTEPCAELFARGKEVTAKESIHARFRRCGRQSRVSLCARLRCCRSRVQPARTLMVPDQALRCLRRARHRMYGSIVIADTKM